MALDLRKAAIAATAAVTLAVGVIMGWEGKKNKAYLDPVNIPTICYGYTHSVRMGDYKNDDECKTLLHSEVAKIELVINKAVKVPLKEYERAAYISFIYNVGEGTFRKSTLLRRLNAGDHKGACNELLRFSYAKGRKLKGLSNRRSDERKLCLGETK